MIYNDFLVSKKKKSKSVGFTPTLEINQQHKDFQKACDHWLIQRGRGACFADCGLGKSPIQIEVARHIQNYTGGKYLLLAPLSVAQQTIREGKKFGVEIIYVNSQNECPENGICITNYQKLHRFNPREFHGVGLDESSILKSIDGKTKRLILESFSTTHFRHAYTATAAPNDLQELGNHAEFLGICTMQEMLSRFFVHDGGSTSKWRLKKHAETEFWEWVSDWAINIKTPSDIGFSNDGYILPELKIIEHIVDSKNTEGLLFTEAARSLHERRAARRDSIQARVDICRAIIDCEPNEAWVIWCNLNPEGDLLQQRISNMYQIAGWDDDDTKEEKLEAFSNGSIKRLVTKAKIAGFGLNWQHCARTIVFPSDSYEQFYQLIRRFWRFGQTREVEVHIVLSEAETSILSNIKRKHDDHEKMMAGMSLAMKRFQSVNVMQARYITNPYNNHKLMEIPPWIA